MGLAWLSEEWAVLSHWVVGSKVHTVCGKGDVRKWERAEKWTGRVEGREAGQR